MATQSSMFERMTRTGRFAPDPTVSPATRTARRNQAIAKGVIYLAAGITMSLLLLIIGYIIVNGLYTRQTRTHDVLPVVEEQIRLDDSHVAALVVPRSLRLKDITYDELREIFTGRNLFWGYITGQNRQIVPVLYGDDAFVDAATAYLLGCENTGGSALPESVKIAGSPRDVEGIIDQHPGALVVLPASQRQAYRGTDSPGIRRVSLAVHPGVLELQDGHRLRSLDSEQVSRLQSGEVRAWADLGGPSASDGTPLTPVRGVVRLLGEPDPAELPDIDAAEAFAGETSSPVLAATRVEELVEAVTSVPGAFAFLDRRTTIDLGLPVIPVKRTTHSMNLRLSFFVTAPSRAGAVGGISYIILNTLAMVAFVLVIATPLGVGAAVYIVEYTHQGRLLRFLRIGTDTLAAVPSIIFGLFGMVLFAQFLGFKTGLLSGTLTLTVMVLPTIIKTSEEALRSVPNSMRQASMALGVTKLQTIFHVVIPGAFPGILTGVLLAIGRAVGETAALLFTMGSNLALLRNPNSPIRVLSVHLYMLIRENISMPNAFATATILVILVVAVNLATKRLIGRMNRMSRMQEHT